MVTVLIREMRKNKLVRGLPLFLLFFLGPHQDLQYHFVIIIVLINLVCGFSYFDRFNIASES
jgi:hypothetical protein